MIIYPLVFPLTGVFTSLSVVVTGFVRGFEIVCPADFKWPLQSAYAGAANANPVVMITVETNLRIIHLPNNYPETLSLWASGINPACESGAWRFASLPGYAACLSISRMMASPMTVVETRAAPLDMMSAVRTPVPNTC